jgi:glycosyltransferase involved in cell wall biosynthesis
MTARARLVIVGEGPERAKIVATAELMGIADRVHLPGFLPEPHRYVGLFDVMALSSKSEQFPIAVVEGMAAGLPIVAPAVGDIPMMVAPENLPYLTADNDEVRLRDTLQSVAMAKPEGRAWLGQQNRAKAVAEYDEKLMIARYAALYGQAMRRPDTFT